MPSTTSTPLTTSNTAVQAGYLRYPDLHKDQVVFCAADDIWVAPATGGVAWRLTGDSVPVKQPRFSPDGSSIAWISSRDGHPEVFVIALAGGESRRLTYWGSANTSVLGWTADGRVLAASTFGEANVRHCVVKAVALDGTVERLPYGPASGLALHPDGAVAVATPFSRPPAWWKRYRGGTASRLWLDRAGGGDWERLLPEVEAGLDSPVWVGDRLVFTSDLAAGFPDRAGEQANLWALDVRGDGKLTQLTWHTAAEGYVRDPRSDGERVVYHAHGRVYVLPEPDARPEPLDIRLGGTVPPRRRRLLDPGQNLDAVLPDHAAGASVVAWRGNVFHLTHRDGPVRALRADSGVRAREPQLLGRTGAAVWVSDAAAADPETASTLGSVDRLETVEIGSEAAPRVLVAGGLGRVLHLQANPAGDAVAVAAHDGRVSVVDVASGAVRELARSEDGEAQGFAFSPDGRYLVWSQPVDASEHRQLMLADLDVTDRAAVPLTAGRFDDSSPAFSHDGKHLLFLSKRTFDPTYDAHVFNLMFTSATRPYLVPLEVAEPSPFGPSLDGWQLTAGDEKGAAADQKGANQQRGDEEKDDRARAETGPDLVVDGFEDRIVAFPVPSGDYRSLQAAKDGVVWIHESADQGALGSAHAGLAEEPADVVEFYSFTKRAVEVIVDKADDVAVAAGGERMVVRSDGGVSVVPVDKKVKPDEAEHVAVDLGRLRFELDPVAEWRQMFDENARIMADHFWREDMDGVDWAGVVERYRPLVERVGSTDDLIDVLWETVGELNTSHAYVNPPTPPGDQGRRLGLLGADLAATLEGWRIERILPGESSDPDARSPLRAAGVGARVGDLVVAVDGTPVDQQFGPAAALQGAAGRPVELTLRSGTATRRVAVVPVADEEALRYQAWVRDRAAYVAEHGGGRLGYVHIPDMMGLGWAQLHRDLRLATRAEGLVVDVRYNRGGHTSQLVIERLARRVIGWDHARHHRQDSSYPENAPRGPVVFVANEFSGSDGDIINAAAQALGVGPVIGVRTWGGVVGIDGRFDLVDGTSITQPRYAFWFRHLGWGVENHGVDPDIEVAHSPADFDAPHDPQLDRAIAEALDRLAQTPAASPPPLPEPKVRG